MKQICQGVKIEIKPCPVCGKDDRVKVLDEDIFENVLRDHDDALIDIECRDCNIKIADYTNRTNIRNYAKAAIHIAQRWNRLPRRACHEG